MSGWQRDHVSRVAQLGLVLFIAGPACEGLLGLGEEPNAGISTSTGEDATTSSSGQASTGAGTGGEGTGGEGGGTSSASTGSTGGGGAIAPCGSCADVEDCRNDASAPALCEEGVCVVRSVDVASDELALLDSRGLPLRERNVAFIASVEGEFFVHIVDFEGEVGVSRFAVDRGGSIVATDTGFMYLSLGGAQSSTLTRFTCGTSCVPGARLDIEALTPSASHGGLAWLGGDRFITSSNDGSGDIVILEATEATQGKNAS